MGQFVRTKKLLGQGGFDRLQKSFVVIAGQGAVGSYATEALARAGVGRLRLVDFDVVSLSNINRQLFALHSTIGQPKAELAKFRVLDINPDIKVEAKQIFIHTDTLDEVLEGEPDLLIDAIDSLNPKVALLAGAVERNIPVLSSMGAALRRNPDLVKFGDISKTMNCPLAKLVRKRLRKHGIFKGIKCVYSTEMPPQTDSTIEMEEDPTPYTGRGRKREALGSLSSMTGIFGLRLATAAIDLLSEKVED